MTLITETCHSIYMLPKSCYSCEHRDALIKIQPQQHLDYPEGGRIIVSISQQMPLQPFNIQLKFCETLQTPLPDAHGDGRQSLQWSYCCTVVCIQRLEDVWDCPADPNFLQHACSLLEVHKAILQLASFLFLSRQTVCQGPQYGYIMIHILPIRW